MSYTIDIVAPPVPSSDAEALELRQELYDADDPKSPPSPQVLDLYQRLTARYPCICDDPDGPWSDGPLLNNFGADITTLGISYSRVAEVLPFVIETAVAMGFVVFDAQDGTIHRATGVSPWVEAPEPAAPWWLL